MKYIFHIDLNAFFASVEQIKNPQLLNKPVVVASNNSKSVVSTASYEARKYGINSAMPLYLAKRLCSNLIIVNHHMDWYEEYSDKFIKLISQKITNRVEIASIDECYIDVSTLVNSKQKAIQLAIKIQKIIKNNLGLNCSIGISSNKFLSKIASDLKKPLGITSIYDNDIQNILWPMPIEDMFLIGKSSVPKLKKIGIYTIKDLANFQDIDKLKQILGKNWIIHKNHANGKGSDEIDVTKNLPKSIGISKTFLIDIADYHEIKEFILNLSQKISKKLHETNQLAKTISLQVKYPNFQTKNKSITLNNYTNLTNKIFNSAIDLFEKFFINQSFRLIGLSVSNLIIDKDHSNIFNLKKNENKSPNDLQEIINKINNKFQKNILTIAKSNIK